MLNLKKAKRNQKIMSKESLVEDSGHPQKSKTLIRSQYQDIMVKVDEDVYYLDRLQLALKSEYFEKLFTEDYAEKNCKLIEIPVIDSDTFSSIVDIIYGKDLDSVVDPDNFVSLIMAMDYLQMEIDPDRELLYLTSPLNKDVFRLYNFILGNTNYEYFLPIIFRHLSENLECIENLDELLSFPFDHISEIISTPVLFEPVVLRLCSRICAKWICHDLENRLPHSIRLANAINYRFGFPFEFDEENLAVPLPIINEHLNQDTLSRYFYKLLLSNGQIYSNTEKQDLKKRSMKNGKSDTKTSLASKSTRESKLQKFLEDGSCCDIIVKVGGKKYKLHRSVLKLASRYFEKIFDAEYNEILAKCEGVPVLPSMDKEYFLDEIDQTTFEIIIDHIYSRKVQLTADIIFHLFKAAHILRIYDLLEECHSWMMENSEEMCAQDVFEILNFTHENEEYEELNGLYVSKYVVDSWPEIGNLPQFIDLFEAITVPEEFSSGNKELYLLDNVDQETFQLMINYIYRDELDLKNDNIIRVLKASEIFKMENLMEACVRELAENCWDIDLSCDDLIEVLRFVSRNNAYNDLSTVYSIRHVMQWPKIDDSIFCSISLEALENILISPFIYFDDPYKILDICSRWITHEIENRYHLVPQIATAISRNTVVNCDDYTMESPPDLKNCSHDFVKSKFLEILSTNCYVPFIGTLNYERKFNIRNLFVFITSEKDGKFSILNSNLDEITSLHTWRYARESSRFLDGPFVLSATMMNDNLFFICEYDERFIFYAYNISLRKLFSLASDRRIDASKEMCGWYDSSNKYTLVNCCNEIYCCIENGAVLKYSFELNRWKSICVAEAGKGGLRFTSDGNLLYRMYKVSQPENTFGYVTEAYNVEQNSWTSLPNVILLTFPRNEPERTDKGETKFKLTYLNNFGFAVLFEEKLCLYHQDDEMWRIMSSLPYDYRNFSKKCSIIAQDESGDVLYMLNNKLYSYSRSHVSWRLKKELPVSESEHIFHGKVLPYRSIVAIQKPIINI